MPVISKDEAIERLTREVAEKLPADELLEVYNELFRDDRRTAVERGEDVTALVKRLVAYINDEQPIDEIVDLWRIILPRYRNASFDEETDGVSYDEVDAVAAE